MICSSFSSITIPSCETSSNIFWAVFISLGPIILESPEMHLP